MAETTVSMKRVVLSRTLQHPLTLYPTAVGVLGAVGIGLFGPITVAVAATVAGLGLGLGHLATQVLMRPESIAAAHFKEMHEKLRRQREATIADLEKRLGERAANDGTNGYGDQALKQFGMVQKRFETMQSLLATKFEPTELTYSRYFVAGEQAFLSVLDTLEGIVSRLHSANAIEPGYYKERMNALERQKPLGSADQDELRTLEERMRLRASQLDAVNTLLTFNENAITEFDRVNAAIAEVKGAKAQTSVDLDSAMRELEALAQRAKKLV